MTSAIVIENFGNPDVLQIKEVWVPAPGPHEVVIQHHSIGVNFHDAYVRSGSYKTLTLPGVPGIEAAGTIQAIGSQVTKFKPGDRVAYITKAYGAYAEKRTINADSLVHIPDTITYDVAASTLLKGLTAHTLISETYQIKSGDWVLIHAAAGGVGLLLCQWARHLGARVIGTVSTQIKADAAYDAGCEFVIQTKEHDFSKEVEIITGGRGVQVVYDSVGKDTFFGSLDSLAPCGHLASYGQASGPVEAFEISLLFPKSLSISRPNIFQHLRDPEKLRASAEQLFAALSSDRISAGVSHSFLLRDANQAHVALESRQRLGSLILKP
ncbi:Quinone oxidoreductase 1 [Xanthomonas hydrangeae]|uniref:quinone oxidoreductase family protein n=1 Tax=Xanthomonas hydrangeae TaxID=2775159 RepID=UPI00196447CA|nr:Quinone oxidoreductase 1 [Xanthomonas hydrangeae]CAD7726536.1 Quinone oxidoreductase 1 [Xanthomonas hydrangeae]CAD7742657.1 Quinone oxidoreductase 1 [Xanthomonas hydrangeae]CAD7742660.1 Quinone oxidoreductase 1 [Xanthomonas hydrangeae]